MSQPTAPTSSTPATSPSPSATQSSSSTSGSQANPPKERGGFEQQAKSSPSTSNTPKDNGGVPSVESVTGGAVKSEKSEQPKQESAPKGETPSEKAERKAEEARIKAKVNGKEREYTLEEARRRLELIDGAEEKFQSASQMRKQAEQLLETLRTDPMKILTHPDLGINFRQLAEEYLGAEVRKEMMDPQQRELEELRAWKAEQEAKRKQAEESETKTKQQREYEEAKLQKLKEYDQKIAAVLSKAQLPKTPYTVKRVAEVLHNAKKKGYEIDLDTAVDFVKENYLTDLQAVTGGLEGEALLNLLGPEIAKRIRKHDLAQIKAKAQPQAASVQEQVQQQPSAQTERRASKQDGFLSPDEWKEMIRKKAGI